MAETFQLRHNSQIFDISRKAISVSAMLNDMLADTDNWETENPPPIGLVDAPFDTSALPFVLAWMEAHKDDKDNLQARPENEGTKLTEREFKNKLAVRTKWDDAFWADEAISANDNFILFHMIMWANFLEIPPLLDQTTCIVANMIKGKKVEEIRAIFNIVNDFTPEEEAQIARENEWART
ncbi:E3 ubiquitin ligase complex SCF subunit sconC [Podospora didyma]|uniref:E3 ubiquitin ligase complex SCF subunit n=1 Tax=Podospora didyma TaxID=330526 RepID=A0AAE0N6M2_9PEZI|nr:E3 ubiquitin ligase complex SCF subunit sconC [Podospora didyma]